MWVWGVHLVLTWNRGVAVELIDDDRVSNVLHLNILEPDSPNISRSALKQNMELKASSHKFTYDSKTLRTIIKGKKVNTKETLFTSIYFICLSLT